MSTTHKQIGYGYQGDEAKELQTLLNNNGYKLDVDGIVGKKTVAAIKDYQNANGLAVDGIVGKNTWGSLLGGSNLSGSSSSSTPTVSGNANQDNPFTLESVKDQIANREEFKFDLNADVLYKQYADKYMRQGQMAMMDTMGQASMMTGGYGNSYAQSVGQQAYQSELQNLNDIVPQLYQMAYDRYNQEGQDLYNQYTLLSQDRQLELDQATFELNQATFEEGQRQYNENAAYTKAMGMLGVGIMPSDDILSAAGIDADTANAYIEHFERQNNSSGGWGYTFMGIDKEEASDGTFIERARFLMPDGSVQIFDKGTNPYTGTSNKDIADGTWDNGYQPDNIEGEKLKFTGMYATNSLGEQRKVFTTGGLVPNPDYGNGSTDKYIDQFEYWIWEDKQNRYVHIEFEDIED